MKEYHTSENSNVNTSRRRVLASFAAGITTNIGRWIEGRRHQNPSHSANNKTTMNTVAESIEGPRLAYVALPGLSTASLLANLPYLMNGSSRLQPTILMDIYDYNRLQAIALKETESPWNQNLAMAYGHLLQRGVIQLIDYGEFYSKYDQRKTLKQNQEKLEEVDSSVQKRGAVKAAEGRLNYQRGEYQESFRKNLGEDLDVYIGGRRTEQNRRQKLQRGSIDPFEWNNEIIDQYAAALEIRGVADEVFDHLDVKYVIGEGESVILREDSLIGNASHIPDQSHIEQLPPEELAYTRDIFETIGELAAERMGVQHDDWMLIAPTLAIPQYDDVFDMAAIQNEIESGVDSASLSNEVVDVVSIIKRRLEDSPDAAPMIEWLMESEIMPFVAGTDQRQDLIKTGRYAMTLAQISNALRPLVRSGKVSHLAGLIGASIVGNPSPQDDFNLIYQQGEELIERLDPSAINTQQLTAIRRRKQGWVETSDWYGRTDRKR